MCMMGLSDAFEPGTMPSDGSPLDGGSSIEALYVVSTG